MLFDTDVLIWTIRGSEKAAKLIDNDRPRFISTVNYMELMQGARDRTEQMHIKHFLKSLEFNILPITENISHRAMILVEEYALRSGMQLADALIAATACEHSLVLCSANEKHFREISSLSIKTFRPYV
ncbi:MAG: type II toxin-antitoxin system VapC family toxin [Victivallales bacterium]|nr:type II toxin-antitoxin system VapC family toxin [Victivallales bacterium]